MCKKILVIIGMVLFVSFKITNLHADSLQIIPPQKPTLSSEEKIKKISKNIITPLKKPSKLKKVEKKIVTKEFKEKKLSFKVPKKKPTVAGVTTRKNIKISKYYSKKDFGLAKKAISDSHMYILCNVYFLYYVIIIYSTNVLKDGAPITRPTINARLVG